MPVWLMENVELLKSRDGIPESYSDGFSDEDETWLPSVAATGRSPNSPNKVKNKVALDNGRAKFLGTGTKWVRISNRNRRSSRCIICGIITVVIICTGFALLGWFLSSHKRKPDPRDSITYRRQRNNPWFQGGINFIAESLKAKIINRKAKNVIIFLGDGMGVSTVTAARILDGQLKGKSGEDNILSWERFPHVAFSKTYNVNKQTTDSAAAASAFMTGVKTRTGVISADGNAIRDNCTSFSDTSVLSLLELAEIKGLSTGVVTTTGITHATPATAYAHTPERNWENDAMAPKGCKDIVARLPVGVIGKLNDEDNIEGDVMSMARQLIEFPHGNGIEVALGGGRINFMPNNTVDPEYPDYKGQRQDGRNLTEEWTKKAKGDGQWTYVWNDKEFKKLDANKVDHVLGLFNPIHMQYAASRTKDKAGEPSLSNMTEFAIKLLRKNSKGYFLLVEGGRIDHGHHGGSAFNALHDAVEMANAVAVADTMTNEDDTLVIVTADHSHVFTIGGYPDRGNPIFGLTEGTALDRKKYTTLGYYNGPGAKINRTRDNPKDTESAEYKQQSLVPLGAETHGGEDVGVYARGPRAHLVHGVIEQNAIFHIMDYALCLSESKREFCGAHSSNSPRVFRSNEIRMLLLLPVIILLLY